MLDPKNSYFKYRIFFAKKGLARFIGHLDLQSLFIKAIKRAGLPMAYSQGFNPHPLISFAMPLSLGMTGHNEILEIFIVEETAPERVLGRLQEQMPNGLTINKVIEVSSMGKSAAALVYAAKYAISLVDLPFGPNMSEVVIRQLEERPLLAEIKGKKSTKIEDIGPNILNLEYCLNTGRLLATLAAGSSNNLKPQILGELFANLMGVKISHGKITYERLEMLMKQP